ncbi:MAG: redoxin domain-containing protein [Acidimicrobiia bacterium]
MTAGRIAAIVGLVAVLTVVGVVALGHKGAEDTSEAVASTSTSTSTSTTLPPILRDAPELAGIDGWLQSDVSDLADLRGKVVILEFWTFGCSNCRATLPYLQDLYAKYQGQGLEIVGVHSPEFDYEKDPVAIQEAADRLGVTWPIALDTNHDSFWAWQIGGTAYWPRTYVIDQQGRIRFDHIGEGAYDELEATVAALLGSA